MPAIDRDFLQFNTHAHSPKERLTYTRDLIIQVVSQLRTMGRNPKTILRLAGLMHDYAARHCVLQNDGFYQSLREKYHNDESKLKIINFFAADLKVLKTGIFNFGERYLLDPKMRVSGIFIKEFQDLASEITLRLDMECAQLLPLVEQPKSLDCV